MGRERQNKMTTKKVAWIQQESCEGAAVCWRGLVPADSRQTQPRTQLKPSAKGVAPLGKCISGRGKNWSQKERKRENKVRKSRRNPKVRERGAPGTRAAHGENMGANKLLS